MLPLQVIAVIAMAIMSATGHVKAMGRILAYVRD